MTPVNLQASIHLELLHMEPFDIPISITRKDLHI
jgi:hypothetical protein